jgi:hypothetical protein
MVKPDIRKKLVTSSCDLKNQKHLAELAVYFNALGEKTMALSWFNQSKTRGYPVDVLKPVFPTPADLKAQNLYDKAMVAYNKKEWETARDLFTELRKDYADSAVVIQKGYDELGKLITSCEEKMVEVVEEPKDKEKTVVEVTAAKQLKLTFGQDSDFDYIQCESGKWTVSDNALMGAGNKCLARIKATKPVLVSGTVRFQRTNSAISITLGENKMMLNLPNKSVFFIDTDKTRKEVKFDFEINTWYQFEIKIDQTNKKVHFKLHNVTSEGVCDVTENDIVFFVDQDNTVYFDNIGLKAQEIPLAVVP